jgi:hypothetical protein
MRGGLTGVERAESVVEGAGAGGMATCDLRKGVGVAE